MNILIDYLRTWLGRFGARPFPVIVALLTPLMLMMMPTNFQSGVLSKGVPAEAGDADLLTLGDVWFVDSGHANTSDGNVGKDPRAPLATLDAVYGSGKATANNGDVVLVAAGHAETLASAGAIASDVEGVTVIGLGKGADRPTFTFSATDSTWAVSAASSKIRGIIIVPSIDAVVSPFVVSAADCEVDYEVRDASSAIEFERALLTTAAADNLTVKIKYVGFTAGNATVNVVRLVGGDNARIFVDFYGVASTAVVELHTTACTNVRVEGLVHNSGTADHTKTVVDTVTGSTWSVDVYDGVADERASGGDQSAIAGDDLSTIEGLIGTADLATTETLHGKLGTDTELADRSLYDILNDAGPAAIDAAADPANDISMFAVIRRLYDLLVGTGTVTTFDSRLGKKVTAAAADILDGVQNAVFTVATGRILLLGLSAEVSVAAVDGGANATNFIFNPTVGTDANLCATLDIDGDELGSLYSISGVKTAAMTGGSGGGAPTMSTPVILPEGTIDVKSAGDGGVGGALLGVEAWYIPLDTGATLA